jgi:hypothetical protein
MPATDPFDGRALGFATRGGIGSLAKREGMLMLL